MENVIYKISNNINDKIYIGSAVKFNLRLNQHKHNLLNNVHHSSKLQNHVNKYGFDSIVFTIIEQCNENNLIEREQYYLNKFKPFFNTRTIAENQTGIKRTQEQIKKATETRRIKYNGEYSKKYVVSEETKKKMSIAHKGKTISEEQKRNHSILMKGRKMTEEQKMKISIAGKGRITKDETKLKQSIAHIGSKNPMFGRTGIKNHNFGKKYPKKNEVITKKVIDLNTGIIYKSVKEAALCLNIAYSTMGKYVLGYNNKIKNFKYYE